MKFSTDKVIFAFSKDNKPAYEVEAPAVIDVCTMDCFSNQLREPEDTIDGLDWDRTNPATGPIYVKGAQPGDTLKVTVNKISVDEKGTVCALENEGTLGHQVKGNFVKIVHVEDGCAVFSPEVKIPLKPMIGVIGVAPDEGAIGCGTPGHHGGNMDNTMVCEGAVLYFPVAAEGALLALGDVHAVMGDGEIGVTGLEIPAEVNLTVEVIKGKAPEYPVLENQDSFSIIVSKETTDEGFQRATELMKEFLASRIHMTEEDIIMLMSLVGDLQVCQIVDPLKTVRFVFPKKYMTRPVF